MVAMDVISNEKTASALRRRVRARQFREKRRQSGRRIMRGRQRWFSGAIILCIALLILQFVISPAFYVNAISLAGVSYYTHEEMIGMTGVARKNVFWLNPAEIRESLLRQPGIEEAEVQVGWPLGTVQIHIIEKQPLFVWQAGEHSVWVTQHGEIMPVYLKQLSLPLVVSSAAVQKQRDHDETFVASLVDDVLALLQSVPDQADAPVLFDPNPFRGLGHWLDEETVVWYGRGGDFEYRAAVAAEIHSLAREEGVTIAEINVAQPLTYHYRSAAEE
ncbi:MAG: FtsQ-type POTRA domain-containing protein [Chloroflexi bacterium]|nr:FtsQ-type POTRA domain-containing protein [Chloroflexota bacterium]